MIRIENLTKTFGDFTAVDGANMQIRKGHIHGLLGPNGAGKTTLIRCMVGLYDVDDGDVMIDGHFINRDNHLLKKRIGIVPQHVNLEKELTVDENLEFSARLYKLPKGEIKQKKEELLSFFELTSAKNKPTKKISGGMKRKLMIARAIIHEPDVIILDEPTVGIDVKSRKEIWEMLLKLKDDGKTILITTHYIEEAEYLCDKISMIGSGTIKTTDDTKNLVSSLGNYTLEYVLDHRIFYEYFETKEAAIKKGETLSVEPIVRPTNLEDVYHKFIDEQVNHGN